MNVKFTLTTAEKLPDLAVTNGQLVYLQDLDEAYYDMNNSRKRVGQVQKVSELPETGREGTLYVLVSGGRAIPKMWDSTLEDYISLGGEVATTSSLGLVQPDGTSITITSGGVISATATAPATTATAGVVQPDGTTITIDNGVISAELPAAATTATLGVVQLDGTTITVDNGVISAELPALGTTAAPGILQPDGTTITVDSGIISATATAPATTATAGVVQPDGTTITIDGSVISAALPAAATTASLGVVQPDGTTITVDGGVISAEIPAPATTASLGTVQPDGLTLTIDENGILSLLSADTNTSKKRYQVTSSSWSADPDASGFYTYTITLTNQAFSTDTAVNLYIAGSTDSTFPTDTEKSMYALVERVELVTTNTVKLSATTKPTSNFYVYIGADGGYADGSGIAQTLADLEDTTITSPSGGQILTYDGTTSKWINGAAPASSLESLTDTTITSPSAAQPLTYDTTSSKWVNGGVIPTANGGTGNADGYIRTGLKSGTTAGTAATAEGSNTTASGNYSHASGQETVAGYNHQFVTGKYNSNKSGDLFEVGNGSQGSASNALELSSAGNLLVAGTITDGTGNVLSDKISTSQTAGLVKNDGTIDTTNYVSDISGKADKAVPATAGNIATLDSTGNLTDGGTAVSSLQPKTMSSAIVVGGVSQSTVEGAMSAMNTILNTLTFYLDQSVTLSTSQASPVTFTDAKITTDSLIDIACSVWGIVPDDVTVSAGSCTVTMPKVDSAQTVTVRLFVR